MRERGGGVGDREKGKKGGAKEAKLCVVYMCVYVHMQVYVAIRTHAETRGGHGVFSSITFC